MRLFSTEQVSKYHSDKYADQISDAILDSCLKEDKRSRVACETMVKGNTIILAGEITTSANVDYCEVASRVARKLGYKADHILTYIETQSPEIAGGIREGEDLGAGDQGMMYGYACNETESMLPFGFDLANKIIAAIERDVETNTDTVFKGDAKCQVTVDLDEAPTMESVKKILVSACHQEGVVLECVQHAIHEILWECGIDTKKVEVIANHAGTWTIGGPSADCGLTGRKIVCDVVKLYDLKWAEVQIAYAIGQSQPMSVNVKTNRPELDAGIASYVLNTYKLTPSGIIQTLDLLNVNYEKLAEGCHYRGGASEQ